MLIILTARDCKKNRKKAFVVFQLSRYGFVENLMSYDALNLDFFSVIFLCVIFVKTIV